MKKYDKNKAYISCSVYFDKVYKLRLLESALRITYTSPKTMQWISKTLKAANDNEIVIMLEKYSCKKIVDSDYQNKRGFGIERIVFTYLDYILIRENAAFKDYQFQFRNSIEHFYPQNPLNGENYVNKDNIDSFGNLALITVSANSKFSNTLPIHKVKQYKDIIELSHKLVKMKDQMSEANREWDNKEIEEHNKEMIDKLKPEIENIKLKCV